MRDCEKGAQVDETITQIGLRLVCEKHSVNFVDIRFSEDISVG